MNCRHCGATLEHLFLDLGHAPPSNAYVDASHVNAPEQTFPLRLFVCDRCWLVQTEDFVCEAELFGANYAYFSSTSRTWLHHAARYFETAVKRFSLGKDSYVVEVASNDGYLLQHFVKAGIRCLGIEPTDSTAEVAEARGIPVRREFFGKAAAEALAGEGHAADLIIANNVYAHVPDINGFTTGLKHILKPGGTVTVEFPHLMRMIAGTQFDTAYHEHFSYLSLRTVRQIFATAGLRVYDVEELGTHGGSLRVFGCHIDDPRTEHDAVSALLAMEERAGLRDLAVYRAFQRRAERIKDDLLLFLLEQKRAGFRIAGYGAAAKGSTLLNFAGVKPDLLSYVCDAASAKQGKYLPGSHIPIVKPSVLLERQPQTVLILPWNISEEIAMILRNSERLKAALFVAIPTLRQISSV